MPKKSKRKSRKSAKVPVVQVTGITKINEPPEAGNYDELDDFQEMMENPEIVWDFLPEEIRATLDTKRVTQDTKELFTVTPNDLLSVFQSLGQQKTLGNCAQILKKSYEKDKKGLNMGRSFESLSDMNTSASQRSSRRASQTGSVSQTESTSQADFHSSTDLLDDEELPLVDFPKFISQLVQHVKDPMTDEDLCQAFDIIDRDEDGFISAEDLHGMFEKFGGAEVNAVEVDDVLKAADTEGRGMISLMEFIDLMAIGRDQEGNEEGEDGPEAASHMENLSANL